MENSILKSVKYVLGIEPDDESFDNDVLMHINSAFGTLNQLGIGPPDGFEIEDDTTEWSAFLGSDLRLNPVKTYVCLRVRLLFDPPSTSFGIAAMQDQIKEMEVRLNIHREGLLAP